MNDQALLAGTVQQMINQNVTLCVVAASTSANPTRDSLTSAIAAFLELYTNTRAKLCQCVEDVKHIDFYGRTKAINCATNELKNLDTSVRTTSDGIVENLNQSLMTMIMKLDQCLTEITYQVSSWLDFINGEIRNCNSYL